jgi:organic hydroperoxide reductase OsmC/OhrA
LVELFEFAMMVRQHRQDVKPRGEAMHRYGAVVRWERQGAAFTDRKYSRAHVWRFDGGIEVPASSSPLVVRVPLSEEKAVDPEEALVASAASCHMLFFLDFAARAGFLVDAYQDNAVATMGQDGDGREFVATIELRPEISFAPMGKMPSAAELAELHSRSHHACYIANSLKSEVTVKGM